MGKKRAFMLCSCLAAALSASAESIREYHERKCAAGDDAACRRAAALKQGEEHGEWVERLGTRFSDRLRRADFEEDNRPLLAKAYPVVMEDYFTAWRQRSGKNKHLDYVALPQCAEHYHAYWRDRKMIWPVDERRRPDWSTIYFFIVEHYYGYCLRQPGAVTP